MHPAPPLPLLLAATMRRCHIRPLHAACFHCIHHRALRRGKRILDDLILLLDMTDRRHAM